MPNPCEPLIPQDSGLPPERRSALVRRNPPRCVTGFVAGVAVSLAVACSGGGDDPADVGDGTSGTMGMAAASNGADTGTAATGAGGAAGGQDGVGAASAGVGSDSSNPGGGASGASDVDSDPDADDDAPVNLEPTVAPDEVVTDADKTVNCTTLQRPPTPLRRLTRFEYNNTVRDLFDVALTPADAFPPDEVADGYTNNALVLTVSSLHAEKYVEAAETLAAQAVAKLDQFLPCDPASTGEPECARQFAESFGQLAYRRPLESEDVAALMEAYEVGDSFTKGIEIMIRTMLQSPHFLYRVEFTGTETPDVGMVRLNGFETASRLSYLLWASAPDQALLDAAAAGQLDTPEQVAAKAREMLTDDRAKDAVAEFYRQWLSLTRLEIVSKDPLAFPLWSDDMRAAMQDEGTAVVQEILWSENASLAELLTRPVGLASGPLAELYGVDTSDSVVELSSDMRAGILTLPGFLAVKAHPDQTSPVLRGRFVREKMLCTKVPPPPDNEPIAVPKIEEGGTARERFSRHSEEERCAGCHQLMDPIGFVFENYDAVGTYRTTDNGQDVDVSGEMFATKDINGPFVGVHELATKLASSQQVTDCVANQWYTFSMGRGVEDGDACSLAPLQQSFTAAGGNLMELVVGTTQTEAFLYRRALQSEEISQ